MGYRGHLFAGLRRKQLVSFLSTALMVMTLAVSVLYVNYTKTKFPRSKAVSANIITDAGFESDVIGATLSSVSVPWVFSATPLPTPTPYPNMLKNPSFEAPVSGTNWYSPWYLGLNSGATATLSKATTNMVDGLYSAKVDVTSGPTTDWYVQLAQQNLTITAGKTYTLSFAARTSVANGMISVVLQDYSAANTIFYETGVTVTSANTWQNYSLTVTPTGGSSNTKLAFLVGKVGGSVWIDNVLLKEKTPTQVASTASVQTYTTAPSVGNTKYMKVTTGTNSDTKLVQNITSSLAPATYTLTFDAYSAKKGKIKTSLNNASNVNYGLERQESVMNTGWTNYSYTFKTTNASVVSDSRLTFAFVPASSGTSDDFYIDNVSLSSVTLQMLNATQAVYNKKILLLIYDPTLVRTGKKLHLYNTTWVDPASMTNTLINYLSTASGGRANYSLYPSGGIVVNGFPKKTSGWTPDETSYLTCLDSGGSNCPNFYNGGSEIMTDYPNVITSIKYNNDDICTMRDKGLIDELWMWGGPYFGFFEFNFIGPKGFGSTPPGTYACKNQLPIMGFNYAGSQENAIHDFMHRYESTMSQAMQVGGYGNWGPNTANIFNKYTLTDTASAGNGGCGTAHLGVNTTYVWPGEEASGNPAYDYNNKTRSVQSTCNYMPAYPNTVSKAAITCESASGGWGCNELAYYSWWLGHMPVNGLKDSNGFYNDWWGYLADPWKYIFRQPHPSETTFNLTDYLSGYWRMNEASGSLVADSFGSYVSRNDATATGTTICTGTTCAGKLGFARSFNGTSTSYVQTANKEVFKSPLKFTLSAWIKYNGGNCSFNNCGIVSTSSQNNPNTGYSLYIQKNTSGLFKVIFQLGGCLSTDSYCKDTGNGSTSRKVTGAATITANTWYHVVAVYELTSTGANMKIYTNNVLDGNLALSPSITIWGEDNFDIGTFPSNRDMSFNGVIDDVAFWTRPLSATEVGRVWNNGSGLDLTGPIATPTFTPTPKPTNTPSPRPSPSITCPQACTAQYGSNFNGNAWCGVQPSSGYPNNEGRAPAGDYECSFLRTSYKCVCDLKVALTSCQTACTAAYGSTYTWMCAASIVSPNKPAAAGNPWCVAQLTSAQGLCGCHL